MAAWLKFLTIHVFVFCSSADHIESDTGTALDAAQTIDCTNYQRDETCGKDAIPHCLRNGTTVLGSCEARRAVCAERQQIDRDFISCTQKPNTSGTDFVDCAVDKPIDFCTTDAIRFCLANGTIIIGRCNAKKAVCVENQKLDGTFKACNKGSGLIINCQGFNPVDCAKDTVTYCLTNGTLLQGSCYAHQAVCLENKKIDDKFTACNQAAKKSSGSDPSLTSTVTDALSRLITALCYFCAVLYTLS